MINISFDNAYYLLLAIPLIALVIAPYAWAIRKENRNANVVASFVLHIVISLLVSFAAAGMQVTAIITKTQVYVVADASFSAKHNLDTVDEYIGKVQAALPDNAQMGVVAFGRDYELLTPLGEAVQSVKNATVDDSATDITNALEYTSTLFDDGVIRRIVLITDGKQTDSAGVDALIRCIENLKASNVYIDAMYVNDNITGEQREVQITGVTATESVFIGQETTADALLQSSFEANVIVSLYKGGEKVEDRAITLSQGYNIVNFELDTSEAGTRHYEIVVSAEDGQDELLNNNGYEFTQTVAEKVNVLFIAPARADLTEAQKLYGDGASLDAYINKTAVPCTVEELCRYDEIVLCNTDVRTLANYTSFVQAVDKTVSFFGKSLLTIGDTKIQNKSDDVLERLADMLPVKFGNDDQDAKLLGIVIDTSRSMQNFSSLTMAKRAAKKLIDLLQDDDYVTVIQFAGSSNIKQPSVKVGDETHREYLKETVIEGLQPTQGTMLGKGLKDAYTAMKDQAFDRKEVVIISDGETYANEPDDAVQVAKDLFAIGIPTSVIHTTRKPELEDDEISDAEKLLDDIATEGNGNFYSATSVETLDELMLVDVADDVTDSIIERVSPVKITRPADQAVAGLTEMPSVNGYAYAKSKASAETVLSVDYVKAGGGKVEAPLYAYWNYGNGKVSTLTTTLTGEWVSGWTDGNGGKTFVKNMFASNRPQEKLDQPYTLSLESDGARTTIEILPAEINPDATATLLITAPDGTAQTQQIAFDASRYYYSFLTPTEGKYEVKIIYAYANKSFEKTAYFDVAYSPEYNRFTIYDPSDLHQVIRYNGTVYEKGEIELKNDENDVATFTLYCALPFLITAVSAFVIDVIIRKLQWKDIVSLFKRKNGKNRKKGE